MIGSDVMSNCKERHDFEDFCDDRCEKRNHHNNCINGLNNRCDRCDNGFNNCCDDPWCEPWCEPWCDPCCHNQHRHDNCCDNCCRRRQNHKHRRR